MEGAYNRVLSARQVVPLETYLYFMDLLAKTVRDELAGCSEKAYDHLSIAVTKKILMLFTDQELSDYIMEVRKTNVLKRACEAHHCMHAGTACTMEFIFPYRSTQCGRYGTFFVFFQKGKGSAPCKEIPYLQLINQTLSYAREVKRIA
ncbi:hypothetical protein Taro_016345 [Colocasia esculenta]|uniref:CSN8/PSMD8/EIF3K domain-containing protein n=1 Tax=Colocasia esculenta TaxID=4460 RepID=A0A843USN3_COLES|nr:hypothetical protein [Colocasia esculenta]